VAGSDEWVAINERWYKYIGGAFTPFPMTARRAKCVPAFEK
jgi:hypothetical protein